MPTKKSNKKTSAKKPAAKKSGHKKPSSKKTATKKHSEKKEAHSFFLAGLKNAHASVLTENARLKARLKKKK